MRRRYLYAALGVVLLALIVAWFSGPTSIHPRLVYNSADDPAVAHATRQEHDDSREPASACRGPWSATSVVDDVGPDELSGVSSSVAGSSDKLRSFTVICETAAGVPVRDIRVKWLILMQPSRRQHELKVLEKGSGTTNEAGQFDFEFLHGDVVHASVDDDGWFAKSAEVSLAESNKVVLVLLRAATVRISATYDDGQPVTYMGSLNSELAYGYNGTFALNNMGFAEVAGVATELPLVCTIFAGQRLGYSTHRVTFSSAELESGNELLVIVPRQKENLGKFLIHFGEQVSRFETSVIIEQEDGTPHSAGKLASTRDSWESNKLPAGRRYRLMVTGPRAWRSGWIEAVAGKVVAVDANLEHCATVRLRLLDSDGLPIYGGVLRVSDGAYLIYNKGHPPSPHAHPDRLSGKDGIVELSGLPSGAITIEAEAWGKQPVTREINLQSGNYVELGDWTLPTASGTIEVQVVGKRAGESYAVFVGGKDGSPIRPFIPFSQDRCFVEHLAFRTYTIGVTLATGGTVAYETVHLSEDSPNQTVLLDVESVQSNRPPRK